MHETQLKVHVIYNEPKDYSIPKLRHEIVNSQTEL